MHAERTARACSFGPVSSEVLQRLARVKLLILDVDGVMTDGGLYFDAEGRVLKRFHVQDGLGIDIARKHGIVSAVITGQDVPAVAARMRQLGIEDYYPGSGDKRESYALCRAKHGFAPEEVAFLGDDWIDLPVLNTVGVPLAVANARPEVKAAALYVTSTPGGHGAVREVIDLLLHSRGKLEVALAAWLDTPAL